MTRHLHKPLALGRTAEVYPWGESQVLKLFFEWFSLVNIEYEQRIGRAIQETGLPVPEVGDIVEVDGRNGLVYQRVDGVSMWERLEHRPWKVLHHAQRCAALHVEMHTSVINADIPSQREKLAAKINAADALPTSLRGEILKKLEIMPLGDRLCHGDFHPGNIIVTDQCECIIDWIDSTNGNPLADVARTSIILLGAAGRQVGHPMVKTLIRLFHYVYRRTYFHLLPCGEVEHRQWLPIVAAARISEGISDLEEWLVRVAAGDQGI